MPGNSSMPMHTRALARVPAGSSHYAKGEGPGVRSGDKGRECREVAFTYTPTLAIGPSLSTGHAIHTSHHDYHCVSVYRATAKSNALYISSLFSPARQRDKDCDFNLWQIPHTTCVPPKDIVHQERCQERHPRSYGTAICLKSRQT